MDRTSLRQRVAASRLAPIAALPVRVGAVARHNGHQLAASARWLAKSREHTNYTYDLRPLNTEHLAWFVASLTQRPVDEVRAVMAEITTDSVLATHLGAAAAASGRRGITDVDIRLGRRAGWYALVRLLQPENVVETGTDKGLGTCVLAAALFRNGHGRVTTIDINPSAGSMITAPYTDRVDLRIGDSITVLSLLDRVDFFLHDSDHSAAHEAAELAAISPRLTEDALVLSDNAHSTGELPRWAEANNRSFAFFAEQPAAHWYAGGGIGVSARRPAGR